MRSLPTATALHLVAEFQGELDVLSPEAGGLIVLAFSAAIR
jgi:hypothetical protein